MTTSTDRPRGGPANGRETSGNKGVLKRRNRLLTDPFQRVLASRQSGLHRIPKPRVAGSIPAGGTRSTCGNGLPSEPRRPFLRPGCGQRVSRDRASLAGGSPINVMGDATGHFGTGVFVPTVGPKTRAISVTPTTSARDASTSRATATRSTELVVRIARAYIDVFPDGTRETVGPRGSCRDLDVGEDVRVPARSPGRVAPVGPRRVDHVPRDRDLVVVADEAPAAEERISRVERRRAD
jgi:hypothetical protein